MVNFDSIRIIVLFREAKIVYFEDLEMSPVILQLAKQC